jgi:hypothetical protein
MKRKAVLLLTAFLGLGLAVTLAMPKAADPVGLTVHEWGTFTSVAGEDGQPVAWRAFGGPNDLPCFVQRFGGFKGGLVHTVRMETPVLYFYGARDSSVDVKVRFPRGVMTEWYPKAQMTRIFDAIEWPDVRVLPGASEDYPGGGESHYYAARETDAAPVQVGAQREKFLFYRGAGTFPLPISARSLPDGRVLVRNLGRESIEGLILFENRNGVRRYLRAAALENDVVLDLGESQSIRSDVLVDLYHILIEQGLYAREAQAMIETWRDSWFEEGARLFYIVPRHSIDSVLPLEIRPAPVETTRVFVGRMEIITPAIQNDVRVAIANSDRAALQKYARFLEPIVRRIGVKSPLLDSVYAAYFSNNGNCE